MGNTRKVSTSQIEADADKDLLRVSKHLLDSAELKAIGRFDGEIRRFLYGICLPFEIGIHLLPVAALEVVEDRPRQFSTDRTELVKSFLFAYPSLCLDAAKLARTPQSRRLPACGGRHARVRTLVAVRQLRRARSVERHLAGSLGAGAREGRAAHGRGVIGDPARAAAIDGGSGGAHGGANEGGRGR